MDLLHYPGVVNNLAVDDGEDGADLFDLSVGHGEIVAIEHRQVGELTRCDRPDLVLHAKEPAVASREEAQRLLAGNLLVAIDPVAERIDARCRKVDVLPGVQRRDMNSIAMNACLNAVIEDRSKRRTDDDFRIAGRDPAE